MKLFRIEYKRVEIQDGYHFVYADTKKQARTMANPNEVKEWMPIDPLGARKTIIRIVEETK